MLLAALLWMVLPLLRAPKVDSATSESAELASYRTERTFLRPRRGAAGARARRPDVRRSQQLGLEGGAGRGAQAANMEQAVAGLEAKLKQNPDNLDGWIMLGRSYMAMSRYPRAADALPAGV